MSEGQIKPEFDESLKGHEGFGLIQVFTGNGKGKTTASIGEAVRAVGAGKRVGIVFFDKGGEHYSERSILKSIGVELVATGRDRIDPVSGRFDFSVNEFDRSEVLRGLVAVKTLFDEGYDLVIADELNSCLSLEMVETDVVLALIEQKPDQTEFVITGRNAPEIILERAHLVTEMTLQKHYFYSGVKAREGIDY